MNWPPRWRKPGHHGWNAMGSATAMPSRSGLTCGGIIDIFVESVSRATFPDLDEVADDVGEHRAVAVATVIAHPDAQWVGRRLVIRPDAVTGSLGSARADAAVADDARGLLARGPQRGPRVWTRRAASGRWHGGLRVQLRSAPADAGVWCHRLRRRPGAAGLVPRLSGNRLRCPPGVRHPSTFSDGRRGGCRLAASVSRRPGARRAPSTRAR